MKEQPTLDVARAYVRKGIFEEGGWSEGIQGLRHKTLPFLFGLERSLTVSRFLALALRLGLLFSVALFPIMTRKALASPPQTLSGPSSSLGLLEGFRSLVRSFGDLNSIDYALGALALLLTIAPKVLDILGKQKKPSQHSPYYDLVSCPSNSPAESGKFFED